jgi:rhodanese-related sulfurtransferase
MSGAAETSLPWEIDVHAVATRLRASDDMLLIDCREPDEYNVVHIEGAELMPMSQLAGRAHELDPQRGRPIVVHCHHGGRSLRVVKWLRDHGFPTAQSMAGGIDAWSLEIDPSKPRY